MPCNERLMVFTRYPEAGVTKTRLIPALGPQGAADLQRRMTAHVVSQAVKFALGRKAAIEVRFEGGSENRMREWLGADHQYCRQGAGDIGARMRRALAAAFGAGAQRAVLIGSDIPGITAGILTAAFDYLDGADLVLGPAIDGGYYLIGIRGSVWAEVADVLFNAMPWGSARVLTVTREKIAALGLQVVMLAVLADIDRPEDLPIWEQRCR